MFDISTFAQGFALGLGMFVCPGPKDILILRQALFRHPSLELVAIGTLSDACLIWLGIAGVSAALSRAPALQTAALWTGVCLLSAHGLLAARRVFTGDVGIPALALTRQQPSNRGKSLVAVLAISFLNPIAWMDTVLVIGTFGAALPRPEQTSFAAGAVTASLTWFLALVLGARSASGLMTTPKAWQILESLVAAAMLGLAAFVAWGLW